MSKRPAARVVQVKGHYIHRDGKRIWIPSHKTHVRKHHRSPKYKRISL